MNKMLLFLVIINFKHDLKQKRYITFNNMSQHFEAYYKCWPYQHIKSWFGVGRFGNKATTYIPPPNYDYIDFGLWAGADFDRYFF